MRLVLEMLQATDAVGSGVQQPSSRSLTFTHPSPCHANVQHTICADHALVLAPHSCFKCQKKVCAPPATQRSACRRQMRRMYWMGTASQGAPRLSSQMLTASSWVRLQQI